MSDELGFVEVDNITAIANAIRERNGTHTPYRVAEMPDAIRSIGTDAVIQPLLVSQNGTYNPPSGVDGYAPVTVSASGGGSTNDNFKIVAGCLSGSIYDNECTNIQQYTFYSGSTIYGAEMLQVQTIGSHAFYGCSALTSVSFPVCTSIGQYAFYQCYALTSVSFPSCTTIFGSAFSRCFALTSAFFPVCTSIKTCAFEQCNALSIASFPVCTAIEQYAFKNCSALSSVSFPVCTTIGSSAFQYCSSLTSVTFPACTSVEYTAFHYCTGLKEIHFPNLVSIITTDCFGRAYNLSIIDLPNVETLTGNTAFYMVGISVSGGISVTLPKCKTLGRAFDSGNLAMGSFPELSAITGSAFNNNLNFKSLYLLSTSVVSLAVSNAFINTPMQNSSYLGYFGSIYVPANLVDAYKSATNWSYFSDRITAYTGE